MLPRAANSPSPPLRHAANPLPPAAHFCSSDEEAGKDSRPSPCSLPRPQRTLGQGSLLSPPGQGAQGSLSSGSPAQQLQRLPCVLPCHLGSLVDGIGCLCVAAEHTGAGHKGLPPSFPPPTSSTVAFTDARLHPHGKHSVSVKGACAELVPPTSPEDRGALGRPEALWSSWTSKSKALIPKMLLNHIQVCPQRQLRTTP